jgi:hypothetical protein
MTATEQLRDFAEGQVTCFIGIDAQSGSTENINRFS